MVITKETVGTPTAVQTKKVETQEQIDWDNLDGDTEPVEVVEETVEEPDEAVAEPDQADVIDFDITYLGEKQKITSKEELKRLAQKGRDYDFVKQKAEKLDKVERENAELKIKLAEQELTQQKALLKKELEADGYGEEVITKIDNHPAIKKAQEVLNEARLESQKAMLLSRRSVEKDSLRSEPFFKEIEPEIDKLLLVPTNAGVTVETIYEFLLGKMARNGKLAEIKSTTRKAVISEMADKAKRGTPHIASESAASETVDVDKYMDDSILAMTQMFGNKTEDIKKYMAKEFKNKKKG
jgi:hypothetical protein